MKEIKQVDIEQKDDPKTKKQLIIVSCLGVVALLSVVGMILAIIFLG